MIYRCVFLSAVFLLAGCSWPSGNATDQIVVILSLDGFRWDYPGKVPTPNFDKIASRGVKAESLQPMFPSKTFPNHYSIATGLYPDHHGIVMNTFYDPEKGHEYRISDRTAVEDGSFYGGEPLWVTAERQQVKSACFFWVGSEAEIGGYRPSYWKKFEYGFPYKQRVDTVISWLKKPETERPRLIMWYVEEPDNTGHEYGPNSTEIENKIIELDFLVGYFLIELEKLPVASKVNVIVTSDHGMAELSEDRKIVLEHYLKPRWINKILGYNPNYNLQVMPGCADSILEVLGSVKGLSAWKTGNLPAGLNYGTHPRTLDIIVMADSSWSLVVQDDEATGKGGHGYDPSNTDMHAIFYAYGPAFKSGYTSPTFGNIDIYPLVCKILGLDHPPVDGSLDRVDHMLSDSSN